MSGSGCLKLEKMALNACAEDMSLNACTEDMAQTEDATLNTKLKKMKALNVNKEER